jgi:type II secretory ATPase GspE/PulE/Tfp pilus assembly ATPase PilB-like protein
MSQTIRDMIVAGATSDAIEVQARKEGMLTMAEDGLFKAAQGQTTIEEILRVVSE